MVYFSIIKCSTFSVNSWYFRIPLLKWSEAKLGSLYSDLQQKCQHLLWNRLCSDWLFKNKLVYLVNSTHFNVKIFISWNIEFDAALDLIKWANAKIQVKSSFSLSLANLHFTQVRVTKISANIMEFLKFEINFSKVNFVNRTLKNVNRNFE